MTEGRYKDSMRAIQCHVWTAFLHVLNVEFRRFPPGDISVAVPIPMGTASEFNIDSVLLIPLKGAF